MRAGPPRRRLGAAGRAVLLGALLGALVTAPLRAEPPARRIVALTPQLAELTAAAGAGDRLVGVVRGADQPPAVRRLPHVGDAFAIDAEAVAALHPDLVLAWRDGTQPRQVEPLQRLGLRLAWTSSARLEDIPATVLAIGRLAGTEATAQRWADAFDARLADLRRRYGSKAPVRVFDQVWPAPLMTVGGPQAQTEAITVCGGVNPFADLAQPAPTISREAVLAADPELIVTASEDPHALDAWAAWPTISAVRHHQLVRLDPNLLPRMGLRMLDGVEQLCRAIDAARQAR